MSAATMRWALWWALSLPMPNGRYRDMPIGVILLQHGASYIEYLASRRRDERCGLAARIIANELLGGVSADLGIGVDLDEVLRAEAAGQEWRRAA